MIPRILNILKISLSLLLISCSNESARDEYTAFRPDPEANMCFEDIAKARSCIKSAQVDDAIAYYKSILTHNPSDFACDSLRPIVNAAMMELLNAYQGSGQSSECSDYFRGLLQNVPKIVTSTSTMRPLMVFAAYSFSRSEPIEEARSLMSQALALPTPHYTHDDFFRDYTYAAAIFFSDKKRHDDVEEWCKMAMKEADLAGDADGKGYVENILGLLYLKRNQISEALALFKSARDDAEQNADILGEVNSYNNLAELYLQWGMPTAAQKWIDHALYHVNHDNKMLEPHVLLRTMRLKTDILPNHSDSLAYYISLVDSLSSILPYHQGGMKSDIDIADIYLSDSDSCMHQEGLRRLRKVIDSNDSPHDVLKAYSTLARHTIRHGTKEQAEAMLDSVMGLLAYCNSPIEQARISIGGLRYCHENEKYMHVDTFTEAVISVMDAILEEGALNALLESALETQKQEYINKSNETTRHLWLIISIFSALLIIAVSFLLWDILQHKRNKHIWNANALDLKEKLLLAETELEKTRELLNIEKAKQSTSLELTGKSCNREDLPLNSPRAIREWGEVGFAERFEAAFPTFLGRLRDRVTDISHREEILCMLIALGKNTFEIESILSIAHASVNMARYRLRKKLMLGRDESLDSAIQDLLLSEK